MWSAASHEMLVRAPLTASCLLATLCSPRGLKLWVSYGFMFKCFSLPQQKVSSHPLLTHASLQQWRQYIISHCCPVTEGDLAGTDSAPPRAALPTWEEQGIWEGRDSKVSPTARPGQPGLETFDPAHQGRTGSPGGPPLSHLLPPHFPTTTSVVSRVTCRVNTLWRGGPCSGLSPHWVC